MDTNGLIAQVSTIIGQLNGLFDEIGVPDHERESRELDVGASLILWAWTRVLMELVVVQRTVTDST